MISIDDRTVIMELIYKYTRACDLGATVDEFMEIFTEDIVLEGSLMGAFVGIDGIRNWVAGCDETRSRLTMVHVVSNPIIESIGDDARVSTYLTELMVYPSPVVGRSDHVTELAFAGLYTFDVRREGGEWRIARRVVRVLGHETEHRPRFDDVGTWAIPPSSMSKQP